MQSPCKTSPWSRNCLGEAVGSSRGCSLPSFLIVLLNIFSFFFSSRPSRVRYYSADVCILSSSSPLPLPRSSRFIPFSTFSPFPSRFFLRYYPFLLAYATRRILCLTRSFFSVFFLPHEDLQPHAPLARTSPHV